MYKLNQNSITRLSDNACIPLAEGNTDYENFIKWRDGWIEKIYDVNGNLISSINHESQGTPQPADLPIPPTYQELRAAEYPAVTMYLDGVVKGDMVQQQAYIDACLAVKAKYPKV